MAAAPVIKKLAKISLTIQNGPIEGHVYEFEKPSITIGRGAENDIVLATDARVSRSHAEIKAHDTKYFITNISQKNYILINGERVEARELRNGDVIYIGDTELAVAVKVENPAGAKPASQSNALQSQPIRPVQAPVAQPSVPSMNTPPQRQQQYANTYQQPQANYEAPKKSSGFDLQLSPGQMRLYGLVAVILLLGVWLFSDDGGQKAKQKIKLRTLDQIASELEASQKTLDDLRETAQKGGIDREPFRSAQEAYLKGFRDYRNGQYSRAMQHFQAALSLNPEHQLAKRYYTLAKVRFDQFVQFNMIQGRKYLERGNYRLCVHAFTQAMILLKDKNDPIYKEAQQFREECRAHIKERF